MSKIPAQAGRPEITVFYPALGQNVPLTQDEVSFAALPNAPPQPGNGRLIVISHGSGSAASSYADLARTLVEAGFVVALPQHKGDHRGDNSAAGPESWKTRPAEISAAIDAMAEDRRFSPHLRLDRVGMYGLSAGGHTALTLAGARWSPARLVSHCEQHIRQDFNACAGLVFAQRGNWLDEVKTAIVLQVLRWRFSERREYSYHEPRIAAIVAAVPYASNILPQSLAPAKVPFTLITSRQDQWLHPEFHSDPILQACRRCSLLHDFQYGGHGAMLSPIRAYRDPLLIKLIADPPRFDRRETATVNRKVAAYFLAQLGN
ncbi:serine aminopeptidase domain-containing protein [Chitinibacter sp. GC72]|uniref:alpha/beta hydrolase family protein n=1 Tax=Chitinibacter sp. GC72 TaxID=1526917 RepID=UPI0012F78E9B|nr:alpha/beta hydrolase [Chitinibacter sp. GC72]